MFLVKGVKRKRPAESRRVDRTAQNRIIRRVENRAADPREQCQTNDLPIGGGEPIAAIDRVITNVPPIRNGRAP
jgi:hypothetical protein